MGIQPERPVVDLRDILLFPLWKRLPRSKFFKELCGSPTFWRDICAFFVLPLLFSIGPDCKFRRYTSCKSKDAQPQPYPPPIPTVRANNCNVPQRQRVKASPTAPPRSVRAPQPVRRFQWDEMGNLGPEIARKRSKHRRRTSMTLSRLLHETNKAQLHYWIKHELR